MAQLELQNPMIKDLKDIQGLEIDHSAPIMRLWGNFSKNSSNVSIMLF